MSGVLYSESELGAPLEFQESIYTALLKYGELYLDFDFALQKILPA